jgi:hypothetical protein
MSMGNWLGTGSGNKTKNRFSRRLRSCPFPEIVCNTLHIWRQISTGSSRNVQTKSDLLTASSKDYSQLTIQTRVPWKSVKRNMNENLSLPENFHSPSISNFKHLYDTEPACNGKKYIRPIAVPLYRFHCINETNEKADVNISDCTRGFCRVRIILEAISGGRAT